MIRGDAAMPDFAYALLFVGFLYLGMLVADVVGQWWARRRAADVLDETWRR